MPGAARHIRGNGGATTHKFVATGVPSRIVYRRPPPGFGFQGCHRLSAAGCRLGSSVGNSGSLRAAVAGRASKQQYEASGAAYDPEFIPADHAAFAGAWSWLGEVAGPAMEAGPGGMIDDDAALVALWGFEPAQVRPPVLFLRGGRDRVVPCSHGQWLARRCPLAERRLCPDDGHISVLNSSASALDWLREQARKR
jgi:pimeloyl-ACP methyl ester carboxylesterase